MSDFINSTIQTLYHIIGHSVPTLASNILVGAPLAIADIFAGPTKAPRQGAWLIAASAGNNNNHKKIRRDGAPAADDAALLFDSMDFFGFSTHSNPRYSAHGFTSEQYPYPLYNGHYHTIIGGGRRSLPSKKMHYDRETIKAKYDGNTLFLEWRLPDARKYPSGPKAVIAVVPGLCSGPNTSYMQRFVLHAASQGYAVVVLATRGMGSAPLEYGNMTAGTFTHDIEYTLEEYLSPEYMEKRFGNKDMKLIGVGFSLGAAMLTNHLGQHPNSRLYCAVAAEAPWDFHASTAMMSTRFAKIFYQPALMKGLWNVIRKTADNIIEFNSHETLVSNLRMLQGKLKKKGGMAGYKVGDFDSLIVAPAQGYPSASAYYTAASPFQRLSKVTVPLMCFSAMDDPITGPPPAIQEWNAVCNDNHNILHIRCPSGGHLGFMRGPLDELRSRMVPGYMDECIVKAIDSAVSQEELLRATVLDTKKASSAFASPVAKRRSISKI